MSLSLKKEITQVFSVIPFLFIKRIKDIHYQIFQKKGMIYNYWMIGLYVGN